MKKCIVTVLLTCFVLASIVGIAWAAEEPAVLSVDNSDLVFTRGSMAYCPVCDEVKLWKKLTNTQAITLLDDDHYYLAEELCYEGASTFLSAPGTNKAACLHLNGHDLTATNARAVQGSSGVLNIMGNGTVSGNYYHKDYLWRGATLDINTSGAGGTLNLYGGTYVKAGESLQESVASVSNNGGILNLFDGATVTAEAGAHSIYVSTINNYTKGTAEPVLGIYGGTVTGGDVYFNGLTESDTKGPATLKLSGGQIAEGIAVLGNTNLDISGDPVIGGNGLQLEKGTILDLSQLTKGAQIAVNAVEVFTDTSGKAYKQYLKPAVDTDCIIENADGSLRYFSNAKLSFAADGKTAYCPACKENVVWTALKESQRIGVVSSGTKHYYLAENQTFNKTYMTLDGSERIQVCLHTNGYALSYIGRSLVGKNATLNLMGTGSVCSDGTDETYGTGTLYLSNATAVINIYGSTVAAAGAKPAINSVRAGKINLYGGTVDGSNTAQTVTMSAGEFTMYGGVIQNGKTTGHGGNISLAGATFTLKGGEIKNGTSEKSGGNILVNTDAVLNIDGGVISGGKATGQGGNVRAYQATVNMTGGTVLCGSGGSNAHNIWLVDSVMEMSGGTVYSASGAQAKAGSAIKINMSQKLSALTLSGDATVIGENGETCGNIYIFGTKKAGECGKLVIEKDWIGTASVVWGNDYACGTAIPAEYGASTGTFTGNLIYEGEQLLGIAAGDDNTLVITGVSVHKADGSAVWAKDAAAAIDLHLKEADSFIRTTVDGMTFALPENKTVYIDFNGKTADVTGKGILCGMDSQNDTYAVSVAAAKVTETVTVQTDVSGGANGYRYIALTSGDTVTFHRLHVRLGAVSLRTSAAGLYYKARYSCDAALAQRVCAYGVALSLQDMPGADFMDVSTDRYSWLENDFAVNAENHYTVEATSCSVFGIFKTAEKGRTPELNASYGEIEIYANPYIAVKADDSSDAYTVLVGDTANAGTQEGMAWSLFDTVKAINDNWEKYDEEVHTKVIAFYEQWEKLGMDQWATELINIAPMKSYLEVLPLNNTEQYASFNVYLPAGKGYYAKYHFGYQLQAYDASLPFNKGPNDPSNSNLYRIRGAYIGTLRREQFTSEFRALSTPEVGFAAREQGAGDFCGGYHGDELMTAVSLTVDGENVPLNIPRFTPFETLNFDLATDIYRCNTPDVKLMEHVQNYQISGDKIDLTQTIKWVVDAKPLVAAYAPMLTAQRLDPNNKNRILTDTVEFYTTPGGQLLERFDTTSYGSTSETGSNETVLRDLKATAAKVYGKNTGFVAETGYTVLDDSIPAEQQVASLVIRYGSAVDSKVYFNLGSNAQPVAGETWKTQVYYRLTYTP